MHRRSFYFVLVRDKGKHFLQLHSLLDRLYNSELNVKWVTSVEKLTISGRVGEAGVGRVEGEKDFLGGCRGDVAGVQPILTLGDAAAVRISLFYPFTGSG